MNGLDSTREYRWGVACVRGPAAMWWLALLTIMFTQSPRGDIDPIAARRGGGKGPGERGRCGISNTSWEKPRVAVDPRGQLD